MIGVLLLGTLNLILRREKGYSSFIVLGGRCLLALNKAKTLKISKHCLGILVLRLILIFEALILLFPRIGLLLFNLILLLVIIWTYSGAWRDRILHLYLNLVTILCGRYWMLNVFLVSYFRAGLSCLDSVLMGQRMRLNQLLSSNTNGNVRIWLLRVLTLGYSLLLIWTASSSHLLPLIRAAWSSPFLTTADRSSAQFLAVSYLKTLVTGRRWILLLSK